MANYDLSSQRAIAAAAEEVEKERLRLHEVGFQTGKYAWQETNYLSAYGQALKDCAKQLEPMQRLFDTVMGYLGENYDSSELYRMFHEDMGMTDDEIEIFGFDFPECCVDIHDIVVESWKDMQEKYPMERDEMTVEEEEAFVADCYKLYEKEGFSPRYWSPFTDNAERVGLPIEIVGRVEEDEAHDLECLPMWKARLDGCEFEVFPEEVVPSEMKANGCRWFEDILEYDVQMAERVAGLPVVVMSPQETANATGNAVKDGNRYYLPKDLGFGVDNIIRNAEARTVESDVEVKDRDLEIG